jgi:hypothetical protein
VEGRRPADQIEAMAAGSASSGSRRAHPTGRLLEKESS